jgi:hypothetical protein
MNLRKQGWWLVVAGAIIAATAHVGATVLEPVSPRQLVREAELIFEGVVTAVEYRLSDVATPDHVALPHTFVTLTIEQTFKGEAATGSSLTLRFQGGPDGQDRALLIPGVPLFDVGERAILFVRGNGTQLCPLVGWEQGRLRLIEGAVSTEHGQELWAMPRGEWVRGPQHALDEVVTHNLAGTLLTFHVSPPRTLWTPPSGGQQLDAQGVRVFLGGLLSRLHTPEQLAGLRPVASAAIQDALYVVAPRPEAPPAVPDASEGLSPADGEAPVEEPPVAK